MEKHTLPHGYTTLQSLWRTYKQVKNPVGSMEESMKRFDGTYTVNLGTQRLIATQDPGLIDHVLKVNHKNYYKSAFTQRLGKFVGNGLLTSNGPDWLKQRRLIQPGFHADKIQALYGIIKQTADDFLSAFPVGGQVDVYPLMNRLAFEIVINTLFNIEVPTATRNELSLFISETQDFVMKDLRQPHKSWWFNLSGEVKRNLKNAERSRTIIRTIIRDRKQRDEKYNDLLDMLLDARYEDTGEPMQEEQVIDEILILLIAGHETTANTLSWTLYLLASHQHELERLKQATHGLTLHECVMHNHLAAVINESMRLYPPAWISDRVALQDDAYDYFGIPKDTIVILFYYGLHRNEKYWPDPSLFIPDRFFKDNTSREKHKAYYPFGAGPRLCIGNSFAMAEMAIFIHSMIHRFNIAPTGITPILKPLVTLRPDRVILDVK